MKDHFFYELIEEGYQVDIKASRHNRRALFVSGVKRINQLFDYRIEYGLFIINHLYDLVEVDHYNEAGYDIKSTKIHQKEEILKILQNEFLPN